jgi:GT2 family glycosyltransferase
LQKLGGTIGALRNFGTKNARGNIVAFIDADCQIQKTWLKDALKNFHDSKIAAVGSRLSHLESTWVAKCWSIMHSEKIVSGETEWVPSGNMVVARKCFQEVNGFDEQLRTSEDYDLCLRLRSKGYKIISDPKISSLHLKPPRTLLEFYKKEKWHGQEMLKIFLDRNQKPSRAFMYATFYLFCMVGIILGGIISLLFRNHWVLLLSTSAFILTPFLLGIETAYRSRNYKYVFALGLMFMDYGIARSVALIRRIIFG